MLKTGKLIMSVPEVARVLHAPGGNRHRSAPLEMLKRPFGKPRRISGGLACFDGQNH